MKELIYISILLMGIFSSCNSNNNKTNSNSISNPSIQEKLKTKKIKTTLELEDYINILFQSPRMSKLDSTIHRLDSLVNLSSNESFSCYLRIDSEEKDFKHKFANTANDYGDYYLKEQNVFKITIKNKELINNGIPISSNSIRQIVKNVVINFKYNEFQPQVELKEIAKIGEVKVSKLAIVLDVDGKIDWKSYLSTYFLIYDIYKEIWNEESIKIWETEFSELEFDKKISILELHPFSLEINFKKRDFNIK